MPEADVLTAVRPRQVAVGCLGREWQLPLHTAAEWIGAIGWDLETLTGVLPGAVADDDVDAMWDLSFAQPADASRRWCNAARVAVGRGGGRDWWWTVNMVRKSLGIWAHLNGQLLREGVDAAVLPFASWLDAAYMLLWSVQDEEGRLKLELELSMMPRGVAVRTSGAATRKMLADFAAD